MLAGVVAGALGVGAISAALSVVDWLTVDFVSIASVSDILVMFLFGVIWGGTGGLAAGLVCAVATGALERWGHRPTTLWTYSAVAAAVTTVGSTAFCAMLVFDGTGSVGRAILWLVVPVAASAAIATRTGAWVWQSTRPATGLAPPASVQPMT
jgi:hypothetical protein